MQREHRAREQGTHQLSATTAEDVATELHVLLRCVRETRRHGEEAVAFAASERVLVDELPQFVSVIARVHSSHLGDAVTHYTVHTPGLVHESRPKGLAQGSGRATLALLLAVHTKL